MNNLEKQLKTNLDGTVSFGRPAIKRPSPEMRERVERALQLGKELGFEKSDEINNKPTM
ncbi:MAG: hypothetical protein LBD23_06875 [Oscillospiraceae bacterium]|jgi:hypothetical protein|nr:hypothetical protein [Oscillospiraceae bacterium]